MQDTGHVLFDNYGCGKEKREELDGKIGTGELTFREASNQLYDSLNVTLEEGVKKLKEVLVIDKDFKPFFDYTLTNSIPFNVISAGIEPILRNVLNTFLGTEKSSKIGIVSNHAEISKDGSKWTAEWRHNSELGHDKAKSIMEYKQSIKGEMPLIVFIGDGVSDLAAASQADILFARRGLALEDYCLKNKIPYIPYDSFADVQNELDNLVIGNKYHDPTSKKVANTKPAFMRTSSTSRVPVNPAQSLNTAMIRGAVN